MDWYCQCVWVTIDGALLCVAVFGVSPKGLPFAFSDHLQTDTTKHFQHFCSYYYPLPHFFNPSPTSMGINSIHLLLINISHCYMTKFLLIHHLLCSILVWTCVNKNYLHAYVLTQRKKITWLFSIVNIKDYKSVLLNNNCGRMSIIHHHGVIVMRSNHSWNNNACAWSFSDLCSLLEALSLCLVLVYILPPFMLFPPSFFFCNMKSRLKTEENGKIEKQKGNKLILCMHAWIFQVKLSLLAFSFSSATRIQVTWFIN